MSNEKVVVTFDTSEPTLPPFVLEHEGTTYTYDAFYLNYQLATIVGIEDPKEYKEALEELLELTKPLNSSLQALQILRKHREHMDKYGDLLKKVFGQWPFSPPDTESDPQNSENSREL